MSYLILGNGGGRFRVRTTLADNRLHVLAKELALRTGASVVLEYRVISLTPARALGYVVAQYVKRGRGQVVRVDLNINKCVEV